MLYTHRGSLLRPSRIIARGFQAYWRASRGLAMRVEGCLVDQAGAVLLTRDDAGGGWRLPGATIEAGETVEAALWRALRPLGFAPEATGELSWVYAGVANAPWDALALYRIQGAYPPASARTAYFAENALAGVCDSGTLARIKDIVAGRAPFEVC